MTRNGTRSFGCSKMLREPSWHPTPLTVPPRRVRTPRESPFPQATLVPHPRYISDRTTAQPAPLEPPPRTTACTLTATSIKPAYDKLQAFTNYRNFRGNLIRYRSIVGKVYSRGGLYSTRESYHWLKTWGFTLGVFLGEIFFLTSTWSTFLFG